MMGVSLIIERVRGTTDERGWGIRTLLDETPILNFFSTGSIMNSMLALDQVLRILGHV
jgi:hypothetical protein